MRQMISPSTAQIPIDHITGPTSGDCSVLSDSFAILIQGILFIVSALTLILKWKIEIPPRTFQVFIRDSSKQIVGSGVIHCWNLALAILFEHHNVGVYADQCAWYWINIMIDTTVGVGINYGLLRLTEKHLGYDSGKYQDVLQQRREDDDPDTVSVLHGAPTPTAAYDGGESSPVTILGPREKHVSAWFFQISVWILICSIMKFIVAAIMYILAPIMSHIGMTGTTWVPGGPEARLVFVMIITPITMNCFQFWVQDSFLKWKKSL